MQGEILCRLGEFWIQDYEEHGCLYEEPSFNLDENSVEMRRWLKHMFLVSEFSGFKLLAMKFVCCEEEEACVGLEGKK